MSLQVVNRLLSRVQLSPLLLPKAAADCDHSNQLTDAHNSAGAAAAATAVVEVHSTLEAIQPLDAGKTIGSVATSQGQASKDEQHDAAFLQSLFCCPVLKVGLQHLLHADAASSHQNPVAVHKLARCSYLRIDSLVRALCCQ